MAKKTNPITGEPMPEQIARLSSMSGYDRKREPLTSGPGRGTAPVSKKEIRQGARVAKKADKAYMKSLDAGIPTTREIKKDERSRGLKPARGINSGGTSTTPNRNASKSGGGKKGNVVKSGKGGLTKQKRGSMDKSCKGPKSWMD